MAKQLKVLGFLFIFFLSFFSALLLSGSAALCASAETAGSFVLDDLRKDPAFDAASYKLNQKDYSLDVIQIAETTEGELLLYVYQPSGNFLDIKASDVTFAQYPDNTAPIFTTYDLEYLNSSGVFFKYRVKNFKKKSSTVRYYNISTIRRPWRLSLDDKPEGDNTASDVPYDVAQLWTVYDTTDGGIRYALEESEVIEIQSKVVGYVQYNNGSWSEFLSGNSSRTNAYFVAFSTDDKHIIENLMEATVEYSEQSINVKVCNSPGCPHGGNGKEYSRTAGEITPHDPVTLHDDQTTTNPAVGGFWAGDKRSWKRIRTTEDFIKEENANGYTLVEGTESALDGTEWVLSFAETQKTATVDVTLHATVDFSIISEVSILRLKFQVNGEVFNIGAVDNHQTGSSLPGNVPNAPNNKGKITAWVIVGVVIVVIVLLCVFVPSARQFFLGVLMGVFKAIWWLICAPVTFVKFLSKRIKHRRRRSTYRRKVKRKR